MRNFFLEIFIVFMSLFISDWIVPFISVDGILNMLIISVIFTVLFNLFLVKIRNGVALFIANLFIFYLISYLMPSFYIGSFIGLFLLVLIFSIVDALMTSESDNSY